MKGRRFIALTIALMSLMLSVLQPALSAYAAPLYEKNASITIDGGQVQQKTFKKDSNDEYNLSQYDLLYYTQTKGNWSGEVGVYLKRDNGHIYVFNGDLSAKSGVPTWKRIDAFVELSKGNVDNTWFTSYFTGKSKRKLNAWSKKGKNGVEALTLENENGTSEYMWQYKTIAEALDSCTKKDLWLADALIRMLVDTYNEKDTIVNSLRENNEAVLATSRDNPAIKLMLYQDSIETTPTVVLQYNDNAFSSIDKANIQDHTFVNFDDLLSATDAQIDKDSYNALYTLNSIVSGLTEKKKEENDKDTAESIDEEVKKFNSKSEFERWSLTISNYVKTDGAEKAISSLSEDLKAKYNLDAFNGENLTEEEVLRLKAYFYLATTKAGKTLPEVVALAYPESGNRVEVNQGGYQPDEVKNAAETAIKNNSEKNSVNPTTGKIALNFDGIARYGLAKIYGYEESDPFNPAEPAEPADPNATQPEDGNVDTDDSVLSESEFLSSMLPDTDAVLGGSFDYSLVLPKIEKDLYIGESESAYNAYLQMQYALVAIASYARFDGYISDSDWKNSQLEDFLSASAGKEELAEIPDNLKSVINAYINIKRGLDYLGIAPYTEYLRAVCEYYNRLLPYENNVGLKDAYDKDAILGEPMRNFFSLKSQQFEDNYLKGVALSASYVPMQTNLYDVSSVVPLNDPDFVEQFHYPFGFYRKALYIDTNINAAVDGYVRSKRSGEKRIATLQDMLEPEKDIVLYVDTNFYNVDKLAEMQGFAYRKMANTEEAGIAAADGNPITTFLTDTWSEFFDQNVENITKTGGIQTYSDKVKKKVTEYDIEPKKEEGTDYVLSSENINRYLTGYSSDPEDEVQDEYSPLQSFAVVSAIYRDSTLYSNIKKQVVENKPVFISSPNLAGVEGVDQEGWNTIYNYAMLKNLKENLGIDYKTTLDLDSPLYIDIYGNIITESGLVVIPAASNSTLYNPTSYRPYSVGFMGLYGKEWSIPEDFKNSEKYMSSAFYIEETTSTWQVKNKTIGSVYMNFRDLPINDADVVSSLITLEKQHLDKGCLDFYPRVYLITEVLRGAPIENINKEFEGISGNRSINKYGMYMAYKLDELSEQLLSNTNGNSMVTLPNLAYLDGVEYIIVFLFKLLFAITLVLLAYKIYTDAVQGFLGLKTFTTFIATLVIFVVVAFSIPKLMDASYYQVNKRLLQDEMQYVALLNLEKSNEGKEIGITSVDVPETKTTLYVKLDSLSVPWYEVLDDVLLSNAFATVDDIYQQAFEENLMSHLPGIIKKSNGLYMDLNYLFNTSTIDYDTKTNSIHQYVHETPYASYAMPYYAILDTLIERINAYNFKNKIDTAETKIQSNGSIKTTNLIEQYFTSEEFMEFSQDVLGFKTIYNIPTLLEEVSPFDAEELTTMQNSLWYAVTDESNMERVEQRVDKLDYKARNFVTENRDLFGKVSDETFLKIMALAMSLEHNDEFGIPAARSIEIFDVDSKDIIRLSMAPRNITMQDTSKSFARFVYDNAGTLGVVSTAILIVVYFVSSLVKPVCMIIILASMIASLIVQKLIKRDGNRAIEGYLITMALLCLTNVVYAFMLKISLSLPALGLTPVVSIVVQILIQFLYFFIIALFTTWVLRDWRNMGFNKYQTVFGDMAIKAANNVTIFATNVKYNNTAQQHYYDQYRHTHNGSGARKTRGVTGNTIYQKLKRNDEERYRRDK